jgi:hypothetical protein
MEENLKKCTACGRTLPISKFYKCKDGKYGVMGRCKECHLIINNAWKAQMRAEIKESAQRYDRQNEEEAINKLIGVKEKPKVNNFNAEFLTHSKTCRICKKRKDLNEFPKDINFTMYTHSICNECRAKGHEPTKIGRPKKK